MKDYIKKRLSETLIHRVIESYLEEDYPTNFDLDEFSKLTSFNKRIQYCQERLKRISSGSSRIVYMVDDTIVMIDYGLNNDVWDNYYS
jgi:predicted lipase